MIEILRSRSGLPTLSVDGILLHSRFDPEKEAERFIKSSIDISSTPQTIVLLGESLGYLTRSIKKLFPCAKIVVVYYSTSLVRSDPEPSIATWHPEMKIQLDGFLEETLDESSTFGLCILEWPASAAVYPRMSLNSNRILSHHLLRLRGNILTTAAMGKLWIRNSIFNFINISSVCRELPALHDKIIVLAGSGPSLEKSSHLLHKYRNLIAIVALPSAMDHLATMDIMPDIIVMTDPGFYSSLHVGAGKAVPAIIAMPVSAGRGIQKLNNASVYFFEQPYFFEHDVLSSSGLNAIRIPPHGTVAATALTLALGITNREIVCTGLDFSYDDIISHARPNTFSRLMELSSTRFSPNYSLSFERAVRFADIKIGRNGFRTSGPLNSYAGWFNSLPHSILSRVYQLRPSEAFINHIPEINERDFENLVARSARDEKFSRLGNSPASTYPSRSERVGLTLSILTEWDDELGNAIILISSNHNGFVRLKNRITDFLYFYDPISFRKIANELATQRTSEASGCLIELLEHTRGFIGTIESRIKNEKIEDRK